MEGWSLNVARYNNNELSGYWLQITDRTEWGFAITHPDWQEENIQCLSIGFDINLLA